MATKRQTAIDIMKANEGKAYADVINLISEAIAVPAASAKSYYKWIVEHNLAPGKVEKTARAPRTPSDKPKAPKAKATPKVKAVPPKFLETKAKITDKTVEEIDDIRKANQARLNEIKAKNLEKLKAVGRKYAKGRVAEARFSDEIGRAHV